jgi:hypothetical protein
LTTVRVPVRVRLELAEDRVGDPRLATLVGEAVSSAAGRAMDRARGVQAVTQAAAGDTPSRFSIGFTGDALPQQVASALDATIRAALWEAAAGLRTPRGPRLEPVPAAARSGEERDEERVVPDPRHRDDDAYLVPSYDDRGAPVAVPLRGKALRSPGGDEAAGIEGEYTISELRGAIRDAFPATRGAPRPGIFYGIYARLRGADRPMLYYVRLGEGGEIIDSLFLYFEPRRRGYQRVSLRSEERRVPLGLTPGVYTVAFDAGGGGRLFRNHELVNPDLQNPHHLDLTVAFVVDPLHVTRPQPLPWAFVPVMRIAAANPESPLATGAQSTYGAYTDIWRVDEYGVPQAINEFAIFAVDIHYRWKIYRLPPEDAPRAAPELVYQAQGHGERAIRYTWQKPGQYEVTCTVTAHGRDVSPNSVTDSRKERVIERQLKMSLELELLERHEREKHEQIWARSAAELLAKAEADLRDEQAQPTPDKAKVDYLKEVVSKLRDQLFPAGRVAAGPFPIHAVFMDEKTSQTRPVSLFLAFEHQAPERSPLEEEIEGGAAEIYHWYLIDVTYPAFYRTYQGSGTTAREALLATFHDSETSIRRTYPPGQILVRVTAADMRRYGIEALTGSTGSDFTHTYETESWQKEAYEWLTLTFQAVGAVLLTAAILFPPTAPSAAALIVTGAVTVAGAALSVASIADRVAHGNFYWDVETFGDIASIVASIAQLGALTVGARASALARVVSTAEELTPELIASLRLAGNVQRALLLTQLGTDAANGLILGYATYEQLRMVDAQFDDQSLADYEHAYGPAEGKQRWLQDRQNRITEIFTHAILSGTMIVVSGVQGVRAYRQAKSSSAVLQELVSGEPEPGAGGRHASLPPGAEPPPEPAGTAGASGPAASTAQPSQSTRPERFFAALVRLAGLRDQAAAAGALRLLPEQQVAEMVRFANLLDVPENATARAFRAEAAAKGASREVQQFADALSLARRIERRAGAPGSVTPEMTSALPKLIEAGWSRRGLGSLIDAVPRRRLTDWSRVVSQLRPEQIQRLGTRGLQDLAYSPRSLSFAAEAGGDAYLTVLGRSRGDMRAVEEVLQGLALRKAEIADPAEYQQLLDRIAAGEATAYEEMGRRVSQAAWTALGRLRAGGRRQLREALEEFEEYAGQLRRQGRAAEAAAQLTARDRLAARIGELADKELDGLEHLARMDQTGDVDWNAALDLPPADRGELLRLVDDVAGRLSARNLADIDAVLRAILQRGVSRAGQLESAFQGGWGQLYAARTLISDYGAMALAFEVDRPGRVVDIVADIPGRGRISVEVKTNLAGAASFVEPQMVNDLATHARSGYTDLLYLYHPASASELPGVGQRMLQLFDTSELNTLLRDHGVDPATAKAAFGAWLSAGNLRTYRL